MGFKMDMTDFERGLLKYTKIVPDVIEKALYKAGSQALIDADTIEPKTPHLEGNLRGAKFIIPEVEPNSEKVTIGFDMPYAARWHETEKNINWSEPGAGPKYLSTKLNLYGKKYIAIVALDIKGIAPGGKI